MCTVAFYCIKPFFIFLFLQCSKLFFCYKQLHKMKESRKVEKSKWSWFPKMCGGGLTYSVYVRLFDRVRQIPQLLSIIWNSNCSEADNTFCSPHNCTGGKNNILLSAHSPWGVCLLNMCAVLWRRLLCMFVPMYVQKKLFFLFLNVLSIVTVPLK